MRVNQNLLTIVQQQLEAYQFFLLLHLQVVVEVETMILQNRLILQQMVALVVVPVAALILIM